MKKRIPLWIKSPIKILLYEFRKLPIKLVICHVICDFFRNIQLKESSFQKLKKVSNEQTYNYLFKENSSFLPRLISNPTKGSVRDRFPIWLFWWQGEDNAPDIVKRCIKSIKINSGNNPVVIINSSNYKMFLSNIPDHILEKFMNKKISITHFSDFYRMALLAEYGGLWIDGSIFMKKEINPLIFQKPLYTIRNPEEDLINVSCWNWTVGVIGGWKGNTLFCAVRDLLDEYWKKNDYLIDYYLFDFMIKLVYENCDMVKEMISSIEINNESFYFLQNNANKKFDAELYKREMNSPNWLYKLSWKGEYLLKTEKGDETFYAQWLRNS